MKNEKTAYKVGEYVLWSDGFANGIGRTTGFGVIEEIIEGDLYKIRVEGSSGCYTRFIHDGWRTAPLAFTAGEKEVYREQWLMRAPASVGRDRRMVLADIYRNSLWGSNILVVTDADRGRLSRDLKYNICCDKKYLQCTTLERNVITSEEFGDRKRMYVVPAERTVGIGLGGITHLIYDRPSDIEKGKFVDLFASFYPVLASSGRIVVIDSKVGIQKMKDEYPGFENMVDFIEI